MPAVSRRALLLLLLLRNFCVFLVQVGTRCPRLAPAARSRLLARVGFWVAGTWLGAAGLTAGRGGGYIGSDRPAVLPRARHLVCTYAKDLAGCLSMR